MSDLFDDEDELPQQRGKAQVADDLFGSDDEGEAQAPVKAPSPEPAAAPAGKLDMKARLAALAAAKKKEQEEAQQGQQKKKKGKKRKQAALVDFGESDEEEAGGEGEESEGGEDEGEGGADGSRRRRPKPAAAAAEARPAGPELDENDEALNTATEADKDFIVDDLGEEYAEQQDMAVFEEAEEAGEEDEFEAMFSKKKKKEGMSDSEAKAVVEALLAQMEVAVEEDHKAFEEGRPAVQKLRLLSRVQDVLSTKRLHSELLDAGLLGVLKAWIEPMSDGTLPNAKVRETVLRLLHQLPIDCSMEDRKEQLKKSGLGRIVMFLFKVPDETSANRRLAKELVERWSRPILAPNRARNLDEEEQARILAARQARQARQAAQQAAQRGSQQEGEEEEGRRREPKFGEPGFRFHASIPQAAALDYVKAPSSRFAMPEAGKAGKKDKADDHKLSKKLKTMAKGGRSGRAAVASVEGRNVTIQH
ncbi:hypothetical protein ABPG77_000151 [Micractinium sp. CCAP 211/92]